MDWSPSELKQTRARFSFCLLARSMSATDADIAMPADEDATGAAVVPHMVPASSASPAGRVAEETPSIAAELPKETLGAQIDALRKEQQTLKDQKKKLHKELRNAVRKKKRLCDRARKLTDKDLVAVLMLRKHQQETRGQALEGDKQAGHPSVESRASPSPPGPKPGAPGL